MLAHQLGGSGLMAARLCPYLTQALGLSIHSSNFSHPRAGVVPARLHVREPGVIGKVGSILGSGSGGLVLVSALAFDHELQGDCLERHSGAVGTLVRVPEGGFGIDALPLVHKVLQEKKWAGRWSGCRWDGRTTACTAPCIARNCLSASRA